MQLTLCLKSDASYLSCNTLKKMLARADKTTKWSSQVLAYTTLLGLPAETFSTIAPLHAAAWEVVGETCIWIHADPVSLTADQNHAFLTERVVLSDNETTALLLDINQFLFADDCVLFAPKPDQWLLNLSQSPDIETTSLQAVLGTDITEKLPTGTNQTYWRRLFTELQMLLYTHPVNEARRKRQQLTVDALWFWGEGTQQRLVSLDWTQIFTHDDKIKGVCYLADTSCDAVPEDFGMLSSMGFDDEKYLIILPDSISAEELEEHWAKPLWSALKQKKIQQVNILMDGQMHHLVSKNLWRWWR